MALARKRLGIVGMTGRMGQQLLSLLDQAEDAQLTVAAALARPGQVDATRRRLERPTVVVVDDMHAFVQACDVVVDFAAPAIAHSLAPVCGELAKPYLVASTGLAPHDHEALHAAASRAPVLVAANLSRGVNALLMLAEQAGAVLAEWDMEIIETHHRHKRDAPSGTALVLGAAIQLGAGPLQDACPGTVRQAPRRAQELGYSVVRGGDVVGEHTALFLGQGERLELAHRATCRSVFAHGAVVACSWLVQQKPGSYTMRDVLRASA